MYIVNHKAIAAQLTMVLFSPTLSWLYVAAIIAEHLSAYPGISPFLLTPDIAIVKTLLAYPL